MVFCARIILSYLRVVRLSRVRADTFHVKGGFEMLFFRIIRLSELRHPSLAKLN